MKDMGPLKHFLGIDFKQSEGEIKMIQKSHRENVSEIWNVRMQTKIHPM